MPAEDERPFRPKYNPHQGTGPLASTASYAGPYRLARLPHSSLGRRVPGVSFSLGRLRGSTLLSATGPRFPFLG